MSPWVALGQSSPRLPRESPQTAPPKGPPRNLFWGPKMLPKSGAPKFLPLIFRHRFTSRNVVKNYGEKLRGTLRGATFWHHFSAPQKITGATFWGAIWGLSRGELRRTAPGRPKGSNYGKKLREELRRNYGSNEGSSQGRNSGRHYGRKYGRNYGKN